MRIFKKNLVNLVLCLITSLAFAYTCSTPANTGDDGTTGDGGNGGDGNPTPCMGDSCVNYADWTGSFSTPPPATLELATMGTDIRSHFLSIGSNGVIDTTGLMARVPVTLSRAGDPMDGVTYVEVGIEGVAQSFVGLLPSTNLGMPLPNTTADATWTGRYFNKSNNATHPITFTIDFEMGTIDATDTQTFITTFDLDFTATGIITGNVATSLLNGNNSDPAPARGLIGEQGLVVGFANTDGGSRIQLASGGFVAQPSE